MFSKIISGITVVEKPYVVVEYRHDLPRDDYEVYEFNTVSAALNQMHRFAQNAKLKQYPYQVTYAVHSGSVNDVYDGTSTIIDSVTV